MKLEFGKLDQTIDRFEKVVSKRLSEKVHDRSCPIPVPARGTWLYIKKNGEIVPMLIDRQNMEKTDWFEHAEDRVVEIFGFRKGAGTELDYKSDKPVGRIIIPRGSKKDSRMIFAGFQQGVVLGDGEIIFKNGKFNLVLPKFTIVYFDKIVSFNNYRY